MGDLRLEQSIWNEDHSGIPSRRLIYDLKCRIAALESNTRNIRTLEIVPDETEEIILKENDAWRYSILHHKDGTWSSVRMKCKLPIWIPEDDTIFRKNAGCINISEAKNSQLLDKFGHKKAIDNAYYIHSLVFSRNQRKFGDKFYDEIVVDLILNHFKPGLLRNTLSFDNFYWFLYCLEEGWIKSIKEPFGKLLNGTPLHDILIETWETKEFDLAPIVEDVLKNVPFSGAEDKKVNFYMGQIMKRLKDIPKYKPSPNEIRPLIESMLK